MFLILLLSRACSNRGLNSIHFIVTLGNLGIVPFVVGRMLPFSTSSPLTAVTVILYLKTVAQVCRVSLSYTIRYRANPWKIVPTGNTYRLC
jgi:hypothetical protein